MKTRITIVSFELSILTKALENDAKIGGVKVVTENRWFTARPSGTEGIYEIFVESFFE